MADYPFTSCSGGHNRVACFFDDRDRFVYLGWLREALERERCRLHAYQCAADRSAAIWTQALRAALEELTVEVVQGTRVEAKALRRHHTHDCQAQHSPGLFHVQHEVSKATSWHLARQVKQAPARVAAAAATWQEARAAEKACHARGTHPRGRPPAFPARSQAALQAVAAAEVEHQQAQTHQKEARALTARSASAITPMISPADRHNRSRPWPPVLRRSGSGCNASPPRSICPHVRASI